MTKVQELYDTCKATFTRVGVIPSPPVLEHLRAVLDTIIPADVGLEEEKVGRHGRGSGINASNGRRIQNGPPLKPGITYLHLHECEVFSMGIFCLSASAVIPLHNHPGMTVLSKLIHGSMHVRAYDWIDPYNETLNADPSMPRAARLAVDHVFSAPCEPFTLYPTSGGNIHTFRAVTSCAVLDVLAPPYSKAEGRHCVYFREVRQQVHTAESEISEDVMRLEEFQPPDDFVIPRGFYRGPAVVTS